MVLWSRPHGNIQSPRTGIVEGNISFGKHNLETGAYFLHKKKKEKKKNFNIQLFFFPFHISECLSTAAFLQCVFLYSEADHTCSSDLLMGPDISYEALRGASATG